MKNIKRNLLFILLSITVLSCSDRSHDPAPEESPASSMELQQSAAEPRLPNILMVLIDDLGYTDLGIYGGDIDTPNLDALGKNGIVFSNAHVNPSCAPTRASLITGKDPHKVGLGSQNGVAPPGIPTSRLGYKGSLEGEYTGLAEVLKDAGYDTFHVGKWHLGEEPHQSPGALGFDHYFSLMDGAASHFSDGHGVGLSISPSGFATYMENGKQLESLPTNFYSTRNYTQWLLDALEEREERDKPFFAYLAYTAVHDPLHAPEDLIMKYANLFSEGFEKLKDQRIHGLVREGLIADSSLVTRWLSGTPSWNELTEKEQLDMTQRMAVYAGMLEYLDQQIGRLVDRLQTSGEFDNTLIVIMSDNGAATVPRTFYARNVKELGWQDESYPLQSIEDYGKPDSFATLGTYNAQAVSGPYFGFKANLHEGGTRVPMIVKAPGSIQGALNRDFVHISDLYSTFADYAGVDISDQKDLVGCSLTPTLKGRVGKVCHDEFGMGYMGWRAYWSGPWKLIFVSKSFGGTGNYALYNLEQDPGEVEDLSAQYPKKVAELAHKWQIYAAANGIVDVPMDKVNEKYDGISHRLFDIYWGQ